MVERELFKNMMKKVIDDTEKNKIQSSEELIQTLIREINGKGIVAKNKQIVN
ncbi:hypothetical protein [Ornithinibacillus xuwenensis]|jgi:ribosomal protein S20|uniref:Uncharacterized protein n=1 Tax=Ornithinibacillus xuwenensis TaxID=3144668 RepID=A0ABU9XMF8_9BACI